MRELQTFILWSIHCIIALFLVYMLLTWIQRQVEVTASHTWVLCVQTCGWSYSQHSYTVKLRWSSFSRVPKPAARTVRPQGLYSLSLHVHQMRMMPGLLCVHNTHSLLCLLLQSTPCKNNSHTRNKEVMHLSLLSNPKLSATSIIIGTYLLYLLYSYTFI